MSGQANKSLNLTLREYYLDWVNNFLTLKAFAEWHDMTEVQAERVLKVGFSLHESFCADMQASKTTKKA